MPVYGDPAHVLKLIRATEGSDPGADVLDRIDMLNAAISAALEEECERTWGVPTANTTHIVWVGPADTIVLPEPARSITSVTYGGTLTGSTMTGGTTVLATDLYYPIVDRNGLILAIRGTGSNVWWWNWELVNSPSGTIPVLVTGDFVSSDDDATVPDDITYIVTYMIAERLKVEKASPFGAIGPDGTVAPLRDVFGDPLVRRIVDKYKHQSVMAV